MADSSADTDTGGGGRRRRSASGTSTTSRAEEALRSSLAEAAANAEAEADRAAARTLLVGSGGGSDLEALHREALSAPAAYVTGVMTRPRLGPAFWVAVAWMGLVVFAAIFANVLPLDNPHAILAGPINQAPTWHHLFGTDGIGHDIFSQVVYGSRISMIVGSTSVIVGLGIGGGLGLVAGFYRKWVDVSVVWVTDVLLTLPSLVLLLTLVAFLGSTTFNEVLAIDVLSIPIYARIARAASLAISQREFVLTALSLGARPRRILVRDVLPLVTLPIASYTALGASAAILAEGTLAFLGLAPPGSLSWGDLIATGQVELPNAPQLTFAPMIVFFITILSLNYIGQKAGNALDPRQGML